MKLHGFGFIYHNVATIHSSLESRCHICYYCCVVYCLFKATPDSKIHWANMGPTWVLLAPWNLLSGTVFVRSNKAHELYNHPEMCIYLSLTCYVLFALDDPEHEKECVELRGISLIQGLITPHHTGVAYVLNTGNFQRFQLIEAEWRIYTSVN